MAISLFCIARKKYHILGEGGQHGLAEELGVPVLEEIP